MGWLMIDDGMVDDGIVDDYMVDDGMEEMKGLRLLLLAAI